MKKSLAILMEKAQPNTAKVNTLQSSIRINKNLIEAKQAELMQTTDGADSLAIKNARMVVAEADYQTRERMMQAAVQNVEAARMAADRQARYLATSVAPVRPEDPSYSRKFENTLLSFRIFVRVYLNMSLTASILPEQLWPHGNFKAICQISPTTTLHSFFAISGLETSALPAYLLPR